MRWLYLVASVITGLMALLFIWVVAYSLRHYPPSWKLIPMFVLVAIWVLVAYKAFLRFRGIPTPESPHGPRPALLADRTALVIVLLFCLIESVWSWVSVTRGVRHHEDLINILLFAFVIFIAISIAYRSSFWADRIVFGAVAGAFALIVVRGATSLSPAAMFAVNVACALMWTIAASVSLLVLALIFRRSHRNLKSSFTG